MHSIANKLAQYGRGGDDTLVHMNQSEVAGLNALNHLVNKRPLSKNPVTGMTEAMDLTDILAGLGIGIAAALTGGAAAAAAPMLLGATAGAAGGAGALGLGALAGAATGAGLNAGKAAIKGDQDIGMAAAFGAGSGALGGLGGAAGAGGEAVQGASNVAETNIGELAKSAIVPNGTDAVTASANQGIANLAPTAGPNNIVGDSSKFLSSGFENSGAVIPKTELGGFAGIDQNIVNPDVISGAAGGTEGAGIGALTSNTPKPDELLSNAAGKNNMVPKFQGTDVSANINPTGTTPGPWEQSYNSLKDTVMNPGQHQGMITAQLGAAGLEDSYKQQGLTEQAGAKQAADIVGQYRKAGIMPNELPKGLTDIANKRKSFAAGGTIRDVQGLGAIPSGYINQQSMSNFYPQSMMPQAQPLQSTQPIRHEVIGYADGGAIGYGYAEGGDIGGGDEGLLHGVGDGQSDGIAGLIEGAQSQEPVRLADSEFVIPADVVSALGSGSTKAGAQALYGMLDRVRQQAYGHIQQTNPVDPAKVLPA